MIIVPPDPGSLDQQIRVDRLHMPELLIPGRKPVGPVIIDWAHPMTRGLKHCIVGPFDLAANKVAAFASGCTYERGVFVGATDHVLFGESSIDSGWSAAVRFKPSSVSNDNILFGNLYYQNGSSNSGWGFRANNANLELGSGNNSWSYSIFNTALVANERKTYVGIAPQSSSLRVLFIDGVRTAPDTTVGNVIPATNNVNVGIFGNDGADFFSSRTEVQGDVDFAFAWNRVLTEDEARSISADPYQFLKPAPQIITNAKTSGVGAWLPDVRMEAPSLLIPKRKPVRPVKIDWANPLTEGLKFLYFPNHMATDSDLVTGSLGVLSSAPLSVGPAIGGQGLLGTTNVNFVTYPRDNVEGSDHLSVFALVSHPTTITTSNAAIVNRNFDGSTVPLHLDCGNRGFAFYSSGWQETGFTTSLDDGAVHSVAGTFDGSTLRYFADGFQENTKAWTGTVPSGNTNDIDIGTYQNSNRNFDGEIYAVFVWDKFLSAAAIKALDLNPYQFLIPE